MVGHTGVYEAIEKAVVAVDQCVNEVVETAKAMGDYEVIIIADHGNADNALNPDGTPNTAHSASTPCPSSTSRRTRRQGRGRHPGRRGPQHPPHHGPPATRRHDRPLPHQGAFESCVFAEACLMTAKPFDRKLSKLKEFWGETVARTALAPASLASAMALSMKSFWSPKPLHAGSLTTTSKVKALIPGHARVLAEVALRLATAHEEGEGGERPLPAQTPQSMSRCKDSIISSRDSG